jgi:thiol-disulfide isomerase/thioredoxin
MRTFIVSCLVLCTFLGSAQAKFKSGTWRGVLTLSEKKNETILPFNFTVTFEKKVPVIEIINADEKIRVTEITINGDSVNWKMPVFDSEFRTVLRKDTLWGVWINYAKKDKNKIPFEAYYNDKRRFITAGNANCDFTGRYEVSFSPGTPDQYKAVGIFKQTGNKITGTFLTETGDYRYLEGSVQNEVMALSCFDGAHAYLFTATNAKKSIAVDTLAGKVYYSNTGTEEWAGKRNENFKLKDPENITTVNSPNEKISFSFKNIDGQTITLEDERYRNKPVIIQLMGTWCPNCMDETAYLAQVYKNYKDRGLEVVALAYEKTTDPEKIKRNITRLKNRYNVDYEILVTGLSGKKKASESMPFLSSVAAFPTTIILDRNHKVKSIYTGFNGPATGKEYENYKAKTESTIIQLLLKN